MKRLRIVSVVFVGVLVVVAAVFHRRLIAVRNANPVLQSGEPVVLATDDARGTLAFGRTRGGDTAVVALNRSDSPQTISIPVPASLRGRTLLDTLTGRRYAVSAATLAIPVGPKKAAVLVRAVGPNLAFRTPY